MHFCAKQRDTLRKKSRKYKRKKAASIYPLSRYVSVFTISLFLLETNRIVLLAQGYPFCLHPQIPFSSVFFCLNPILNSPCFPLCSTTLSFSLSLPSELAMILGPSSWVTTDLTPTNKSATISYKNYLLICFVLFLKISFVQNLSSGIELPIPIDTFCFIWFGGGGTFSCVEYLLSIQLSYVLFKICINPWKWNFGYYLYV